MTHAVDLCFAKTAPPPTWGMFADSHLRQWVSTGFLVSADLQGSLRTVNYLKYLARDLPVQAWAGAMVQWTRTKVGR
jgi:hypothetical protein